VRQVPYYLLGVLGLVGALGGRVACGWLCPFGWLQEQLFKIPVAKWAVHPRQRAAWWVLLLVSLGYGASVWGMVAVEPPAVVLALYLIAGMVLYIRLGASRLYSLVGLSLLMPFFTLEPWFSKLCPAGILEGGIPQVMLDADLRELIGPFFGLKLLILVFFLGWMAVTRRPFCRWICPLGAIWSPFNRCSTLQLCVDQELCIRCDRCQKVCPVDIRIYEDETDPACVRCMQCVNECPVSCIGAKSLLSG